MTLVTRAEHLAWCKERALACVDRGEIDGAIASMLSDLGKHPELKLNDQLAGFLLLEAARNRTAEGIRRWINGFN